MKWQFNGKTLGFLRNISSKISISIQKKKKKNIWFKLHAIYKNKLKIHPRSKYKPIQPIEEKQKENFPDLELVKDF